MSQYLLSFARENLEDKPDAYLALLWCIYKGNGSKGRYSDHIKSHLSAASERLLSTDYQKLARRIRSILDGKPELDWVAPSGLTPLASLQVKNFRGFGDLGRDDKGTLLRFSKSKNIYYAPNGGGKSSLCEALEFGTTGHIKEADRRKTKIRAYVARGSAKTILNLTGTNKSNVVKSITWSSCFIDRNRLQEFSLLGSKDTGSAEGDVLATLFGLEEFQEVISRFVRPESFNLNTYLRPDNTVGMAALTQRRGALIETRRALFETVDALNSRVCQTLGLASEHLHAVKARFARLEKLRELKVNAAEKLKSSELPVQFSLKQLDRAASVSTRLLERKAKIDTALLRDASALNFRAVFEAIHAIEHADTGDTCPACATPLRIVTENPFDKARRELQALNGLTRLQEADRQNKGRIIQLANRISAGVLGVDSNTRRGVPCTLWLEDIRAAAAAFQNSTVRTDEAVLVLKSFSQLMADSEEELGRYVSACDRKFAEVSGSDAVVAKLDAEVKAIKLTEESLRLLFDEKRIAQRDLAPTGAQMADLARQRSELVASNADNVRFNSFIQSLKTEYANLHHDLISYKLSLERSRLSGIEAKAAEYYKAINNHDDEHERIDTLYFEKADDSYRIKISNTVGTSIDAFSILSEGHLRALGLSLLLAVAEKNKFPLIVFDDVVNAIDSDHRSNIIDLIFSDPYLCSTQMVVTTHDRLFWERFCIIADRHRQADQHASSVMSYTNKGIVLVDHAGGFQEKVYRALAMFDIRQALVYCRIWFESMVLEYCVESGLSVTARFGKSQVKQNTYLQLSLEDTFRLVEQRISYDLTHFGLIKSDLVNWRGQNQEHHAFDEGSLNFVHSKTSKEVVRIYDALRLLQCQLFPGAKKDSGEKLLISLNQRIERGIRKIAGLGGAPPDVQQQHGRLLQELRDLAAEATQELQYIEQCIAATQAQDSALGATNTEFEVPAAVEQGELR
ncbi:ATP-binding protein [Pseudomonas glycinae]|uniref:ATP-binding protein n=1 Tax=Pseudomonas glycinae TaxID=1785145 RepID=UPI001F206853|nr:ATP-binding protein [Pseudomonas glycinae]